MATTVIARYWSLRLDGVLTEFAVPYSDDPFVSALSFVFFFNSAFQQS